MSSLLIALGLTGALVQGVAPRSASISGQVLEDGSQTPIAGAEVILTPIPSQPRRVPGPSPEQLRPVRIEAFFSEQPRTAVTDRAGRYAFDDVEPGRYQIRVQKAGFALPNGPAIADARFRFADARRSSSISVADVDVEAGQRLNDVNVMLQKGAVIAGRVLDETGEPLVDVRVMAMQKAPVPPGVVAGREPLIPTGAGNQTNDLGEFRLFGLPPGEYYVQAMPRPDFGGSSAARATTMLATYFPGTSDARGAQPIAVGAGQTAGEIEIRMISAAAFQVSGVVLDEARRPVVNAMVRLTADDPTSGPTFMMGLPHQARTDRSGRFSINNVTSGTYTLVAEAPVMIAGSPAAAGGVAAAGAGGFTSSLEFSSGLAGGTIGGGVITETSNGTTIQYRGDTATRLPITVNQANVTGLEVIVRPPAR